MTPAIVTVSAAGVLVGSGVEVNSGVGEAGNKVTVASGVSVTCGASSGDRQATSRNPKRRKPVLLI
jgi:hypothetical protein